MGSSGSTLSPKNFDASRMPTIASTSGEVVSAENAVIFNVGIIETACFGPDTAVHLALNVPGFETQVGETSCVGMATSSMLQKGFTFALDKRCLEVAVLTMKVMSCGQERAERDMPVKTLKYSGQKFFYQTVSFGMFNLPGLASSNTPVPTVKMAFELLSVGDGRLHIAKKPRFMDLELAITGGKMQSHPLEAMCNSVTSHCSMLPSIDKFGLPALTNLREGARGDGAL